MEMSTTDNHSARTIAEMIADVLELSDDAFADEVTKVRTFDRDGFLTTPTNDGLTIAMEDGTRFQVVVRPL